MGLISETVNVKWHNTTKKYYEDKGYIFTKMGDEFEIKVKDLSKGSNVKVKVYCDCCKKEYELTYYNYKKQNHNGKNYCKTCINSMFRIGENNNRWNPNLTQEEREMSTQKKLTALFDYQRFERNARLQTLIADTENRCLHALSADDLEWVSAAGEETDLKDKKDRKEDE